jgi:hypothetical protein
MGFGIPSATQQTKIAHRLNKKVAKKQSPMTPKTGLITVTPLQLVIAKKIVENEAIRDFALLNINPHHSAVLEAKYAQLAALANSSNFLVPNISGLRFLGGSVNVAKASAIYTEWKLKGIKRLILASIDTPLIQLAVKIINPTCLWTFDDGVVNLCPSGSYHSPPKRSFLTRLAFGMALGPNYQNRLRERTERHFTIYDVSFNIAAPDKLIKIDPFGFESETINTDIPQAELRVFIGFDPGSPQYDKAVELVNPDIYIVHPMEKKPPKVRKILRLNTLAEEFISSLLATKHNVHIYSVGSSVLLNLRHNRLRKTFVNLHPDSNEFKEIYALGRDLDCEIMTPFR